MRTYYVYVLASLSRVLYVGVTNDVRRRLWQHKSGIDSSSFTHRHHVTRLVHLEPFENPRDAITREKQLKGWPRERKVRLIERHDLGWLDVSRDWLGSE